MYNLRPELAHFIADKDEPLLKVETCRLALGLRSCLRHAQCLPRAKGSRCWVGKRRGRGRMGGTVENNETAGRQVCNAPTSPTDAVFQLSTNEIARPRHTNIEFGSGAEFAYHCNGIGGQVCAACAMNDRRSGFHIPTAKP